MRAHAAAQFTLTCFGAWRWAVLLLSLGCAVVAGLWVSAPGSPAARLAWPLGLGALTLLGAWLWALQPRGQALSLRWDGQRWTLARADRIDRAAQTGDLRVAMDLGAWMLLRFVPEGAAVPWRVIWVPAQRSGHEAQWHALRCAVYSPRPDTGADAAPDV